VTATPRAPAVPGVRPPSDVAKAGTIATLTAASAVTTNARSLGPRAHVGDAGERIGPPTAC
jgi:hypothetical protein